jgi:membrane fusion protein (multidrug efflux system)
MFMHVEVVLEERPAVLIPEEAVTTEADGAYVFVVEDGRAQRRTVQLGQRTAGAVEVLDGLEAGQPVVRQGVQRLRDGASIRLLDSPSTGAGPPPKSEGGA